MKFIPARFGQRILLGLGVLVPGFLGATASVDKLGIPGTAIQGRFGETRAAALETQPSERALHRLFESWRFLQAWYVILWMT